MKKTTIIVPKHNTTIKRKLKYLNLKSKEEEKIKTMPEKKEYNNEFIEILEQLKNLPALKNNKDFEVLYEFIMHRQNNPDPRYTRIQ